MRGASAGSAVLLVALQILTQGACGERPVGSAPGVIRIDGSSTVFPIAEAVTEEFRRAEPGVRMTVGISGTGGGFEKFCRGEIDLSTASRPIASSEQAACTAAGILYVELPVAYDGIVVVVNPSNDWVTELSRDELRRIWRPEAQDTVTRWSQVRPDWPDREIHLFGPGVDSGTFDLFTTVIVGATGASRGDVTSSEDDNLLVQGIAGDENAIGYFGYGYYEENRDRLRLVGIRGDASSAAMRPTPATLRGSRYPLARPLLVYVRLEAIARPEVRALMDFWFRQGAALAREVRYVPLSPEEYALARRRFERLVTGTMFDGRIDPRAPLATRLSWSEP